MPIMHNMTQVRRARLMAFAIAQASMPARANPQLEISALQDYRESSDPATVWKHGVADRRAALAVRLRAAGKQTGRGKEGADRSMRSPFKSGTSGFFRTLRRWSWPLHGVPESLGMEGMEETGPRI